MCICSLKGYRVKVAGELRNGEHFMVNAGMWLRRRNLFPYGVLLRFSESAFTRSSQHEKVVSKGFGGVALFPNKNSYPDQLRFVRKHVDKPTVRYLHTRACCAVRGDRGSVASIAQVLFFSRPEAFSADSSAIALTCPVDAKTVQGTVSPSRQPGHESSWHLAPTPGSLQDQTTQAHQQSSTQGRQQGTRNFAGNVGFPGGPGCRLRGKKRSRTHAGQQGHEGASIAKASSWNLAVGVFLPIGKQQQGGRQAHLQTRRTFSDTCR